MPKVWGQQPEDRERFNVRNRGFQNQTGCTLQFFPYIITVISSSYTQEYMCVV